VLSPPLVCLDEHGGTGPQVLPIDAPRDGDRRQSFADLQLIPRFVDVDRSHPGSWALFAGDFGLTEGSSDLFLPPRSPLFAADGRWSNPEQWVKDVDLSCDGVVLAEDPIIRRQLALQAVVLSKPNGEIELHFAMKPLVPASVQIIDILGRLVVRIPVVPRNDGLALAHWNGASLDGRRSPVGVYFYRLVGGAAPIASGKILLIR
jgi:hypothetical protein